jgi:hypothetical protein
MEAPASFSTDRNGRDSWQAENLVVAAMRAGAMAAAGPPITIFVAVDLVRVMGPQMAFDQTRHGVRLAICHANVIVPANGGLWMYALSGSLRTAMAITHERKSCVG